MSKSTQELIGMAQARAAADTEHAYTQVPDFNPHTWVWLAMRDAYNDGMTDAINAHLDKHSGGGEVVDVTKDMVKVALSAYMRGDDMKGYVGYSENMRMALEAVAPMFATLAHPRPAVPEFIVPSGWVFYTADFSTLVSGRTKDGRVILRRDEAGTR